MLKLAQESDIPTGGPAAKIPGMLNKWAPLTHRGRMTHICVGNLTKIGSDNDLAPGWCQVIIWLMLEYC